ncbi:hypothetical protein GCK72_025844 [Caenorhabditis remanei]|uniref:Uncharacterized protein n=1 Tax=Caenorhabditis remanei TaxID=31234 RepID=A0A6A5G398_CAERE|nr:hypothetical protein GCK72_025844 [Caenorhabditis remanei]KAF1749376.1 hypothetical protein GCK72_025844 [Caenorhabditis remanei]
MEHQMMMIPTTDYIHFTGLVTCKYHHAPAIQSIVLWEHNILTKEFLLPQELNLDQTMYPYKYDIKATAFGDYPTFDYEFYVNIVHNCSRWMKSKVQQVSFPRFDTVGNITCNKNIQLD